MYHHYVSWLQLILLSDYYNQIKCQALIVLRPVKNNGNVKYNPNSANITHYARKCFDCMYEDIGVKIFNKRFFSDSKKELPVSLEDDIYKSLIGDDILKGVLTKDNILDIGSHKSLQETEKYFSSIK